MLLRKLARNHAEDTLSDVVWCLCKQDSDFAKKLISEFILFSDDFSVVDIVRNYVITNGCMPDLTFLLRHKKTNQIVYLIIETKITASQNIYSTKSRTKRQYAVYTNYLKKKNKKIKLDEKYNFPEKCILLSPSYYEKHSVEDNVIDFRFPALLKLLKKSANLETKGVCKELIKYLEEEFEGTRSKLKENLGILNHKIELRSAQKHILSLRDAMLEENQASKSGLWQNNSFGYHFSSGLKNKYSSKTNGRSWSSRSWLSYNFYYEDDIKSPLKLIFPNKLIKKNLIKTPQYHNKHQFTCDVLTESKINNKFINIFKSIHCSDKLIESISAFTNYYKDEKKQTYLVKYNELLNSIINFIEMLIPKIEYYHIEFRHNLKKPELLLRLKIVDDKRTKFHLKLVAEPTCFNINDILRIEVFERKKLTETITLLEKTPSAGYVVKSIDNIIAILSDSFEKLRNQEK